MAGFFVFGWVPAFAGMAEGLSHFAGMAVSHLAGTA
jgi:hypothetical protein